MGPSINDRQLGSAKRHKVARPTVPRETNLGNSLIKSRTLKRKNQTVRRKFRHRPALQQPPQALGCNRADGSWRC
ncbi:uncharacterized protein PgNI_07950 [Pyricularia grisea]|uniref:Uncharacterized protein n=1 Tax=Pyricularia grisea TaxID=148305 RepID=A0A6P8B114_PYRGI|nr:uncharacterized protein PgNI_07950 [Pyricularia grisea]TLD08408.1 hypothetical protein PgNI_07950 [Pyricularia grisea]